MIPAESIDYVNDLVRQMGLTSADPGSRARAISEYVRAHDYGINEAVQSGIRFRYPHQIDKQLTCGEAGVYTYMMAKSAGLNPKLYRMTDFDGLPADHMTVDVEIEGQREALDPLYNLKGQVKYKIGQIIVPGRRLSFRDIQVMDDQDIQDFIDYINSPEGILDYLATNQKCAEYAGPYGTMEKYVRYSPKEHGLIATFILHNFFQWVVSMQLNGKLQMHTQYGRESVWGDVKDVFYEFGVDLETGLPFNRFHPDNYYKGLKQALFRELMYFQTIAGAKHYKNGDGVFSRDQEESERLVNYLEEHHGEGREVLTRHFNTIKRTTPEYLRRALDHFTFLFLDYDNNDLRKQSRAVMKEQRGTTLEDMVNTLEAISQELAYSWSYEFYQAAVENAFGDTTIFTLRQWTQQADPGARNLF